MNLPLGTYLYNKVWDDVYIACHTEGLHLVVSARTGHPYIGHLSPGYKVTNGLPKDVDESEWEVINKARFIELLAKQ